MKKTEPNEIKLNILGTDVKGITSINFNQNKKPYFVDVRLEISEDEYFKLCKAAGKEIPYTDRKC